VLKLLGVLGDINAHNFSTVTELMTHGNIMQYIKANYANRLELVMLYLIHILALLILANTAAWCDPRSKVPA
jgi:hypothetical protein